MCDDRRLFVIFEALSRGIQPEEIHAVTKIDTWFLYKLVRLVELESRLKKEPLTDPLYLEAKQTGYPDSVIASLSGRPLPQHRFPGYKMVDTCAGEFAANTPYFYASYDEENEAEAFIRSHPSGKKTVIVFGSGPIRIGQGIEFDYASVHSVWALKEAGYEVVIVNNNPETVSTDFDTADRLYFEPLTPEDALGVIHTAVSYTHLDVYKRQVTEKVAYLKGLIEGFSIDENSKEGKLLKAVMDVLSDLAVSVEDLEDYTAEPVSYTHLGRGYGGTGSGLFQTFRLFIPFSRALLRAGRL